MNTLLQVTGLKKYFPVRNGFFNRNKQYLKAVDGVDFTIGEGETFGLVGESGCGKSTIGRLVLRLLEPTEGQIVFDGEDLCAMDKKTLRGKRREIQIVFQDPYGSLNPRMTAGQIIGEPMAKHRLYPKNEIPGQVRHLLAIVGLNGDDADKYPHEFSGGQRQRIVIARALSLRPRLIVCDEPVSALDVSIQAQILNLLVELQKKYGIAYLFIAHGMAVVQHVSHRIGVMYLGKLVELSSSQDLFDHCLHPYTKALMSAVPIPDPEIEDNRRSIPVEGEVPSPIHPPTGCRFHTRCPLVCERCRREEPLLRPVGENHFVACHLA